MVVGFANRNILCGEWRRSAPPKFFGEQNEQFRFAPNSSWPGLSRPPMLTVYAAAMDGRHRAGQDGRVETGISPAIFRGFGWCFAGVWEGGCAIPRKQPHQMSW